MEIGSAQSLKGILEKFERDLKKMGSRLTQEDLMVATESLERFSALVAKRERQEKLAQKRAEEEQRKEKEYQNRIE